VARSTPAGAWRRALKKSERLPSKKKKRAPSARSPSLYDKPPFLEVYPSDPELDRLVDAFERGNFALVRERGPRLAETSRSEDVRRAALDIVSRTHPPAAALVLLGLAMMLLVLLSFYYFRHRHV
jgi:hypothetical protein